MTAVALAHRVIGSGGPWVLVLHGLLGSGRNWAGVAQALADTCRVCLVDLRNHGGSPWLPSMSYDDMAEDVAALATTLGADRVALIGHSMGGKVAMRRALARPGRIERLAVVDIAPVAYAHDHRAEVEAMRGLDLRSIGSRGEADEALAGEVPDRTMRQFLLANLARGDGGYRWQANLEAIAAAMPELAGFPATHAVYSGPALAVAGGASPYIRSDGEVALRRHLPHVRIERIDGAGHWPHAERPDAVTALLRAFVAETAERVRG